MTSEDVFLSNVAARVEDLTGLEAKLWPGGEIRISVNDDKELRASASGFWGVHLFERDAGVSMVGTQSHPTGVSGDSADVDVVAQAICDSVTALL